MSDSLAPIPAGIDSGNAAIPEDWTTLRTGEMFSRRVERGRPGLPVMSIVMGRGLVERESVDRRVDTNLPPAGHLLVRSGDLAYNMMRMWQGVLGRGEFDCMVSPAYIVLQSNGKVDPHFAEYLFSTEAAIAKFRHLSYGVVADRLRLYYRDLIRIPFDVPKCPDEQRAIAAILSTLDASVQQAEALTKKHEVISAGMMQDIFARGVTAEGSLRPARTQAPSIYKQSPLGYIPSDWNVETLGTVLEKGGGYIQTGPFGSQLHAADYQHDGVPVVMPQDITNGRIASTHVAKISPDRANDLLRHRMKIGDIIIARRGDLARAAAISHREASWVCGTGCFLVKLGKTALSPEYISVAYRQDFIQRQIAGLAVGTTMPSLNNKVMARLQFPVCDPAEQDRIIKRLTAFESSVRRTLAQREVLVRIRAGLMQDLLTGRVRVKLSEAATT